MHELWRGSGGDDGYLWQPYREDEATHYNQDRRHGRDVVSAERELTVGVVPEMWLGMCCGIVGALGTDG